MTKMEEYQAFVACLTYGEEMVPMTVEDAQYTLDMWKEEGSIEVPEGFTAEIYAEIWNSYCPPEPEDNKPREIILGGPELSFEISECGATLDDVIAKVTMEYPGWKFDRTEARYHSCVMAIFTKE